MQAEGLGESQAVDPMDRPIEPYPSHSNSTEGPMIEPADMSVLVVDDMDGMRKSVRGMLKVLRYGKVFHFAQNGLEAWNLLKEVPIDVAIVDWNMPVMTGVELLSRIREDSDLRDLPVVMVTAEANSEIVAEAAESEIDAYILKPLTAKSLGDKISSVIEKANNPPPVVRHLKKSRNLEEDGDVDAAIEEVKLAMNADPLSSRPIRELGHLYAKKNDLENAEEWLLKAAEMNSLDVFAFHHLGELYLKKNDIEKASAFFDKAMNISPRHVGRGINFGKILVQKNMIEKAIKVFDKAIGLSDNSLAMQEEIADFCLQNGMEEYAIQLWDTVLSHMPSRYDIMLKLGICHERRGNCREALTYLMNAEKKDKDNIEIKIHLAKNYIGIGQVLRSEHVLKSVMEIDPENAEAKELLRQSV